MVRVLSAFDAIRKTNLFGTVWRRKASTEVASIPSEADVVIIGKIVFVFIRFLIVHTAQEFQLLPNFQRQFPFRVFCEAVDSG